MSERRSWAAVVGLVAVALALTLDAGCGGAGPALRDEEEPRLAIDPRAADEAHAELVETEAALDEALARPAPNCADACRLGASVCQLSSRICTIAQDHPEDAHIEARCADGRTRCGVARTRVHAVCTCEAP